MTTTVYGPLTVAPLTGVIGAEVSGLRIGALDDEALGFLKQAWRDWKVLFFRDQNVSSEDQVTFGKLFGELEIHPFLPDNGLPEIVVLDSLGGGPYRAERWHHDVSFRACPPNGSILQSRVVPPWGGDTLWADMELAYELLDDAVKERIEHMTATHTLRHSFGRRMSADELEAQLAEFPDQHHPVVRVHPETGRRSLFVNTPFTSEIDDIDPVEGARLLDLLLRQVLLPTVQVRFRWSAGAVAMWDNRNTQHCAAMDFDGQHRRLERVTLMGERPFGPADLVAGVTA